MDEEKTTVKRIIKKSLIPTRYILSILAFVGLTNIYAVRTNLSIAVVAMVKVPKEDNETTRALDTCPELMREYGNSSDQIIVKSSGDFDWPPTTQGHLLSAFFYGYIVSALPGGIASSWYGGKWILGWGVFLSGVLTLLSPVAARWSPWALFTARVGVGLGTGVAFPCVHCLIGKWMPESERSVQNTIIYNGIPMGTICTLAFSGLLIDSGFLGGWPSVFYVTGATTCLWFVFWALLVHESPYDHPFITQHELDLITGVKKSKTKSRSELLLASTDHAPKIGPIPWRDILSSYRVYALCVVHFCNNWGFYTLLTFLPTYLKKVLHFNIKSNGFLSATPYICLFIFASVSSLIIDKIRSLGIMNITTLRKFSNSIAFYIPGLCLLIIPYVGCYPVPVVILLSLCSGFNGFKLSGFHVTPIDMSPDFAGVLIAATNTAGTVAGIAGPVYAGRITHSGDTLDNWKIVFITATFFYFLGGTVYNLFCTAEEQPWGRSRLEDDKKQENSEKDDETDSDDEEKK